MSGNRFQISLIEIVSTAVLSSSMIWAASIWCINIVHFHWGILRSLHRQHIR